jgi:hypothetical protein
MWQFSISLHFKCSMCIQYLRIRLLFWIFFVFGYLVDKLCANLHNNSAVLDFTNRNPSSRCRLHSVIHSLRQLLSVLRRQFDAYSLLWKFPSSVYFEFAVRI